MWTESVTEQSQILLQHISRGSEKNTKTSVKTLLFQLKFKQDTSQNTKSEAQSNSPTYQQSTTYQLQNVILFGHNQEMQKISTFLY